jgi:hypothetical protein
MRPVRSGYDGGEERTLAGHRQAALFLGGWASLEWDGGDGGWEVLESELGPEVLTGPLRLPKGSKRRVPRNQLQ